jgi:hypothetical protein
LRKKEWAGNALFNQCTPEVERLGVEDVFREANESIAAKARELRMEPPIPFLCECSDKRCFARIPLTIEEYGEARAGPQRYLTTSGHQVEGARVIAEDEHFALAEKL